MLLGTCDKRPARHHRVQRGLRGVAMACLTVEGHLRSPQGLGPTPKGPLENQPGGFCFIRQPALVGRRTLGATAFVAVLRQDQVGRPVAIEGKGRKRGPP